MQRCRGARAGQTSNASHELTVFRVPPGLERRDYPGKRPPLLSASSGSFGGAGLEHVLSRWLLAAALSLVMFRDISPGWRGAVPQPCDFPCTDAGGVQRWVILMFSLRLELQAAKQGEQTIRSVSIESDACGWRRVCEKLQRRQPQNKRPLRSVSFLFRRKEADKNGTVSRPPLWRFGGQGLGFANAGTRARGRTMEVGHVSTTLRKKKKTVVSTRLGQALALLVGAHCELCDSLFPSVLFPGHASPTPRGVLRLQWSTSHRSATFSPETGVYSVPDSTLDDKEDFSTRV